MNSDAVFSFVGALAAILAVGGIAIYQAKRTGENFVALASKLGFVLETTGKLFKKHRLTGRLRGKPIEVFSYTTGAGKSRRTWAAMTVAVSKTAELTFSLERKVAFIDFFARMFRSNEAKTGDEIFDQQWLLKTNQPELMQAILLPELRQKLMRYAGDGISSPSFKLEVDRVQYSEQGSFSKAVICARIADSTGLLCDLADAVEVGAELKNPSS